MPLRSVSTAYLAQAGELRDNDQQWAAYESTGHCIVLAGPGSGRPRRLYSNWHASLLRTCEHHAE